MDYMNPQQSFLEAIGAAPPQQQQPPIPFLPQQQSSPLSLGLGGGGSPSLGQISQSIIQGQQAPQASNPNIFQDGFNPGMQQQQMQQPQQQQEVPQEQPQQQQQQGDNMGVGDYANMFMAAALAAYKPEMLPLLQYLQNFQGQGQEDPSANPATSQGPSQAPPPEQGQVVGMSDPSGGQEQPYHEPGPTPHNFFQDPFQNAKIAYAMQQQQMQNPETFNPVDYNQM